MGGGGGAGAGAAAAAWLALLAVSRLDRAEVFCSSIGAGAVAGAAGAEVAAAGAGAIGAGEGVGVAAAAGGCAREAGAAAGAWAGAACPQVQRLQENWQKGWPIQLSEHCIRLANRQVGGARVGTRPRIDQHGRASQWYARRCCSRAQRVLPHLR